MSFDAENFGLGVLVGWGSAYALYRVRHVLKGAATSVSRGATSVQNSATRSADSRYVNDLIETADSTHLGGMAVKLSDIIVEPRFVPAPEFALPDEEEAIHNIFRVIPSVHDHPFLHAPFNIDTLSIDDISTGSRALALLGLPGSGRTTALLTIALHSLGTIKFKPPLDKIQAKLDSDEAALSEKERSVRVKERILIEQRAKERLANEQGLAFDADADEELKNSIPLFRRLMPVYVHFADLLTPANEYGSEVDPAEPIVRAVQYNVKRVTASTIPRSLYSRFNKGQILLLVDGYDDLPEFERPRALAWLDAFMDQYHENFVIVAGPATGFGAITRLGFTPVFMRPWSDLDTGNVVERWAESWTRLGKRGRRAGGRPDQAAIDRAKANNRALLPLEVTAKAWASYTGQVELPGYEGWIRSALSRLIPGDQPLAAMLPWLAQIAVVQLEEGYVTSARLRALRIGGSDSDLQTTAADRGEASGEAADPSLDALRTETSNASPKKGKKGAKDEEDAEMKTAQGRLLASLRKSGMLLRFRGDRYQFRHPLIASYLASLTLKQATDEELNTKLNHPTWKQAASYTALHTSLNTLIRRRLAAHPDVLQNNLLDLARLLAYAPVDAPWRGDVLRTLGNHLVAPNQYPLIRERAAAALLDTRDVNTLLIFRRAVRNMSPDIRRLACLGMGAVGDVEAIRDLKPLIQDQVAEVQLAAGMALGAVGTEEALETMLIAFTEGSEQVRQAMAEAFAAMPNEGYAILHEAVEDQDMMLRRASVFGLRRIRTTWALIAIYRAFLEDEQWYVRSAAQQAFQEIQYGRAESPTAPYPPLQAIPWLAEWAASRGETMPSGEGAQQMMLRALQEGEPQVRALAAVNLGQLGLANMTKALYNALRDRQDDVRSAAHKGLAYMQMQIGQPFPTPS
jgi:HEAT repeat protein